MAKLTPRKTEVDAVAAILASDTYESERDMAKAVLSASFELLRQRDVWAVAHFLGEGARPTFFGIEPTENAARALASSLGGGKAALVLIHGSAAFQEHVATSEEAWRTSHSATCVNCGHEKWAHEKHSFSGRPSPSAEVSFPCSNRCKCDKFVASS